MGSERAVAQAGCPRFLILACLRACFRALVLATSLWSGAAQAHEVRPTVGDLSLSGRSVTLELDLNVEAFVAGVDLDSTDDTNAVQQAELYDTLRGLPPEALADRFAPVAEEMARTIMLRRDDGSMLSLTFEGADLGPVGDVETLRDSRARFTAVAETPLTGLTVTWPEGYGTLILRQMGVVEGYTGFLDGGMTSGRIATAAGTPQGALSTALTYLRAGFDAVFPGGLLAAAMVLALSVSAQPARTTAARLGVFVACVLSAAAMTGTGVLTLPAVSLEPVLATALVVVAGDTLLADGRGTYRFFLAAVAGLLHGLVFGAGLAVFGLPDGAGALALPSYLAGILLALMAVTATAYLAVGAWFADRPWYRGAVVLPLNGILALLGLWALLSPSWP